MAVNVPAWNCYADLSRIWDLHFFREVGHALLKVFRPLANNIVRDDDA